jgi:putative addiction module component (TIGR02574 family)
MNTDLLITKFNLLSKDMQLLIFDYIDFLLIRNNIATKQTQTESNLQEITPELKTLLDQRIAEYEQNPQNVVSWDEVKKKFNSKYGYEV